MVKGHLKTSTSNNAVIVSWTDTSVNPPREGQLVQQPLVLMEHGLLVGFTLGQLSFHLQTQLLILLQSDITV